MMNARAIVLTLLIVATNSVFAEGGCPPGQYPYDTPQARQCVPIPGGASQGNAHPAVVFQDRWGAIAKAPGAPDVGVSVGQASKRKATVEALRQCASRGAKNCELVQAFRNECAAIATGGGFRGFGYAVEKNAAVDKAIKACSGMDGVECAEVWSDCSLPVRVR